MSEDALEPEPLHHLGQDAALQRVIDELVVDGPQRSVGDLADRLVATLRQRGMPAMPKPWIQAVAASAADGNPYVVSRVTAQTEEVPSPQTYAPSYGID
ncbi:MAG: hypothetical protein WCG47_27815 [Dermatophilaceae bacterium]